MLVLMPLSKQVFAKTNACAISFYFSVDKWLFFQGATTSSIVETKRLTFGSGSFPYSGDLCCQRRAEPEGRNEFEKNKTKQAESEKWVKSCCLLFII